MKKLLSIFILLLSFQHLCYSQKEGQEKIDSLLHVLKTAKEDTTKVYILNALAGEFVGIKPDTAIVFANRALTLATQLNDKPGIARAYLRLGTAILTLGNYLEALKNYSASLKISEEIRDKKGVAYAYTNLGYAYRCQGNHPEALKNYTASLKIFEEIKDTVGMADNYLWQGELFNALGNYPEALKFYFSSLKINEQRRNKEAIANCYLSIGNSFYNQGDNAEALKYYSAALKLFKDIGSKNSVARVNSSLGNVYFNQGNYSKALEEQERALKTAVETNDKWLIAFLYRSIGSIYTAQGNMLLDAGDKTAATDKYLMAVKNHLTAMKFFEEIGDNLSIADTYYVLGINNFNLNKISEAKANFEKALKLTEEKGYKTVAEKVLGELALLNYTQGDYKKAYEHYKMHIVYRDSLVNEENTKKSVQMQMSYDFDKKESLAKADQEKKNAIMQKELQKQKLVRNGFVGGGCCRIAFCRCVFLATQQN